MWAILMSILSDEVINDPLVRGYAAMTDLEAANSLNVVNRQVNRTMMTGSELLGHADAAEYAARTSEQKDNWLSLCGIDFIDPFGSAVQVVIEVWGGGSVTVDNLQAARVEAVSRAVELNRTLEGEKILIPVKEGHIQEIR